MVDWFSKHPYFFNVGIMYETRNGMCTANLRNDEFRTFLPRKKKDAIRYAAINVAFGKLGISDELDADNKPKSSGFRHRKGGYKWK